MTILITGASGFVGRKLTESLMGVKNVIGLSRTQPNLEVPYVKADFHSFEDLRKLDSYSIDTVVHLAAVLGGCSEEQAMAVNVQGTRRLFRYLIDRGCKKFISASSIAATGCLDPDFVPLQLPIPDQHPCFAKDAYGFSKAMMEETNCYFQRKHPETDFINLRLGAVVDDETWHPPHVQTGPELRTPFAQLSRIYVSDVVLAIMSAIEAPMQPGVRTFNTVGPDASCVDPLLEVLASNGRIEDRFKQVDTSHYRKAGNEFAPVFDMCAIRDHLGFVPKRSTRIEWK